MGEREDQPILGTPVMSLYGSRKGWRALVLGNGPSRRTFDLRAAQADGWLLYSCNRFYQEEGQPWPDYIGSVDKPPTKEHLEKRVCADTPVITRKAAVKYYRSRA